MPSYDPKTRYDKSHTVHRIIAGPPWAGKRRNIRQDGLHRAPFCLQARRYLALTRPFGERLLSCANWRLSTCPEQQISNRSSESALTQRPERRNCKGSQADVVRAALGHAELRVVSMASLSVVITAAGDEFKISALPIGSRVRWPCNTLLL